MLTLCVLALAAEFVLHRVLRFDRYSASVGVAQALAFIAALVFTLPLTAVTIGRLFFLLLAICAAELLMHIRDSASVGLVHASMFAVAALGALVGLACAVIDERSGP